MITKDYCNNRENEERSKKIKDIETHNTDRLKLMKIARLCFFIILFVLKKKKYFFSILFNNSNNNQYIITG